MKVYNERWYDENAEVFKFMEKLKHMDKLQRDRILIDIKNIIVEMDEGLIDRHLLDFPMTNKKRWYDSDPYSWMIINVLKYADEPLLNNVIHTFKGKI